MRTRPRFRLRTLLIALTAICLWLGWYAERAQRRYQANKAEFLEKYRAAMDS